MAFKRKRDGSKRDRNSDKNDLKSLFSIKKTCRFCVGGENGPKIDYKDIKTLQGLLTDRGKIVPRRISGNCARHQRALTRAVKRARHIALLSYTSK
jgi:small subunit ribosomal protein S18